MLCFPICDNGFTLKDLTAAQCVVNNHEIPGSYIIPKKPLCRGKHIYTIIYDVIQSEWRVWLLLYIITYLRYVTLFKMTICLFLQTIWNILMYKYINFGSLYTTYMVPFCCYYRCRSTCLCKLLDCSDVKVCGSKKVNLCWSNMGWPCCYRQRGHKCERH